MTTIPVDLIVHYPATGRFRCRGFRGLFLGNPVMLVFDGAVQGDQPDAASLGEAVCDEILRYVGITEHGNMPCSGRGGAGCYALTEPGFRKLLVYVAGAAAGETDRSAALPIPWAETIWQPNDPMWEALPTLRAGTDFSSHVPPTWHATNAVFWQDTVNEVVWAVLQRVGLAPEDSRIFISYLRKETQGIADQLFSALNEIGFDVFLDRCSVPPGVDFQARLMQDITDKAVLMLLNSPGIDNSEWVGHEIARVKAYRLGLCVLNFPKAPKRRDVDPDDTFDIRKNEMVGFCGQLTGQELLKDHLLAQIVQTTQNVHHRALHRRRWELITNFGLAAEGRGAILEPDGTFYFPSTEERPKDCSVGLTARIPTLSDYWRLHSAWASRSSTGYIVSPSPFAVGFRKGESDWLGGLSNIRHQDEGQMIRLAQTL